ncbi:hypothetical protein EVAR_49356_1 [Eumeta japonica]|uniref:Uncharacterized protein n=1 Tax=Eumeta variegata TaxID=151549 RepID=A0A4C1XWL3_EUMVA|nr:hypothetical protein EVAR_49356_1 [Eumeta japonica]
MPKTPVCDVDLVWVTKIGFYKAEQPKKAMASAEVPAAEGGQGRRRAGLFAVSAGTLTRWKRLIAPGPAAPRAGPVSTPRRHKAAISHQTQFPPLRNNFRFGSQFTSKVFNNSKKAPSFGSEGRTLRAHERDRRTTRFCLYHLETD